MNQITRRSALTASLTTLLAAGAASMVPTTTQAAPEPTTAQHDLLTLTQTDADFAAWYERWEAKRDEARDAYFALSERVKPRVDDQTARLIFDREEERVNWQMLDSQLFAEITFRHFPGIAPALRLAWEHALEQYTAEAATYCSDPSEPW
jgi:hypothetical protein